MDNRTPAEIAYDQARLSPVVDEGPWAPILDILADSTDDGKHTTIAQQIAACGPVDIYDPIRIPITTLDSGETVTRPTFDAAPADWVTVKRGAVEIDIRASGEIAGISFAGHYLDDSFTLADVDDLRALLSIDRAYLTQLATMGPEVDQARDVWDKLPYAGKRRTAQTIGFGEWFKRWKAK